MGKLLLESALHFSCVCPFRKIRGVQQLVNQLVSMNLCPRETGPAIYGNRLRDSCLCAVSQAGKTNRTGLAGRANRMSVIAAACQLAARQKCICIRLGEILDARRLEDCILPLRKGCQPQLSILLFQLFQLEGTKIMAIIVPMFAEKQIQYEKFVVDYQPRLMAYVSHFVDNRNDAQDVLQECFLILWTKYSGSPSSEYPKIIFRIVRNKCLDYLKHRKVAVSRFEPLPLSGEERLFNLDFGLGGADSKCIYEELQSQVDKVLDSLPERCREVFMLSRFKKMKNREIAEHLGISVSMVEKHIRKALNAFTEALNENTPLLFLLVMSWKMMDKM